MFFSRHMIGEIGPCHWNKPFHWQLIRHLSIRSNLLKKPLSLPMYWAMYWRTLLLWTWCVGQIVRGGLAAIDRDFNREKENRKRRGVLIFWFLKSIMGDFDSAVWSSWGPDPWSIERSQTSRIRSSPHDTTGFYSVVHSSRCSGLVDANSTNPLESISSMGPEKLKHYGRDLVVI